jgi:hypothetical protein
MVAIEGRDHNKDQDSTIISVLDSIFMEHRFDDTGLAGFLANTIGDESGLSEMSGEDAEWVLYYRRLGWSKGEYWPANWPEDMEFCAGIALNWDKDSPYLYSFMGKDYFYGYLQKAIRTFIEQHPDETVLVEPIMFMLDATSRCTVKNRKALQRKFRDVVRFTSRNAQNRLVLDSIFEKRQFDQLACLLTEGNVLNCMRGEPGWELKRCDPKESCPSWVTKYSSGISFYVYVNPEKFYLNYHKSISHQSAMSEGWLHDEIKNSLRDFLEDNPSEIAAVQPVIAVLEAHGVSLDCMK